MSVDKKIDYVAQDGVKNYVKNSPSVTVPKKFKARKEAPATKLAYITDAEAKMLKKMKKGTPHKGPKGIPSYDSFDADGNFTSGAAMSAAETGSKNQRDRAEVRASNIGGPKGLAPGVTSNEARDLRSAFIAAGGGQRVNPGFFDSRNVVSPAELARAKAFNPKAFRAGRRGGIMDFITSGGIIGSLIRKIGQGLGFGKKYNEPTYDMSQFNNLGLFSPSINPNNLDIYNEFIDDEEDEKDVDKISNLINTGGITNLKTGTFNPLAFDNQDQTRSSNRYMVPFDGARTIFKNPNFSGDINIPFGGTVLEDEFPSNRLPSFIEVQDTPQSQDDFFLNAMADATTFPTDDGSGISLMNRSVLRNAGYNDSQIKEAQDAGYLDQLIRDIEGPIGGSLGPSAFG